MRLNLSASSPLWRSLRHRNYRLYLTGQLVSVCGTWMQQVAALFPLKWMCQGLRSVFLPESFGAQEPGGPVHVVLEVEPDHRADPVGASAGGELITQRTIGQGRAVVILERDFARDLLAAVDDPRQLQARLPGRLRRPGGRAGACGRRSGRRSWSVP